MNSTLKSLLFWVLLVVLGVLIWNFSSTWAGGSETKIAFTEFLAEGPATSRSPPSRSRATTSSARCTAARATGRSSVPTRLRVTTPAWPTSCAANGVNDRSGPRSRQPLGHAAVLVGPHPADDRLLDLHHAADAERREQGPVVRQEPREAVIELAEEGHVQGRLRRRRSQGRTPGDHRVPEGTAEVPEARWPHPQGRAAHGLAGHRQDAARPRRRR